MGINPTMTDASELKPKKILFIHHSTGENLLNYGNVRKLLKQKDSEIEFWDHGYNLSPKFPTLIAKFGLTFQTGLSDNNGKITGTDYNLVISNDSPKEYAEIFARENTDPTLKEILKYDIIIFKNCFPTTKIDSDKKLEEDISYYNQIRESLKKYPDKTFIVFTPPPLRKEVTKPEWAERARKLADYMDSENFVNSDDNLKVFNFFDLLADNSGENNNVLKRNYTNWFYRDSHPNKKANIEIAPVFVDYILKVITN